MHHALMLALLVGTVALAAPGVVALRAGGEAPETPLGILLVAAPELQDPHFRETVVLVTRHLHGAPVGVILNRPSGITLGQLFPDHPRLMTRTEPVGTGGPVAPHSVVFVFRAADRPREALRLLDDVYMSVSAGLLDELLARPGGPPELRAFAGFAGWAAGQLEAEIAHGGWHVLPPDSDTIFRKDPATMWRDLLRRATARTVRADASAGVEAPVPAGKPWISGRRST